jgi:NAD(P)-dependent dehydrogenase (short-subunit alcohol dehydrogenase family)
MEGGRHGITCNAIVPGIIGTEAFHMANASMNERIAARTVFKRPGEPQDIANAIADALGLDALVLPATPAKLAAHIHGPEPPRAAHVGRRAARAR